MKSRKCSKYIQIPVIRLIIKFKSTIRSFFKGSHDNYLLEDFFKNTIIDFVAPVRIVMVQKLLNVLKIDVPAFSDSNFPKTISLTSSIKISVVSFLLVGTMTKQLVFSGSTDGWNTPKTT